MADPFVRRARGVFQGTVGSTAFVAGDGIYFDGTDWELSDADDNTKFAEAFSTASYASGVQGNFCTECIIEDTDAPYTQGSTYYLSTTAGDLTTTRPTGAENLCQVLAFGISTSLLHARVKIPEEVTINLQFPYTESAAPQDFDGDYHGVGLDDTSAAVGACFEVPQNMVGNVTQRMWHSGTGVALDTGDTVTIDVSGGVDDETTSATADGMTATSLAVAANDLALTDISTAFDGSGLLAPGNVVGLDVKKAAEGAGGDDPIMLCASVVLLVV
jgi:hypothetical protein